MLGKFKKLNLRFSGFLDLFFFFNFSDVQMIESMQSDTMVEVIHLKKIENFSNCPCYLQKYKMLSGILYLEVRHYQAESRVQKLATELELTKRQIKVMQNARTQYSCLTLLAKNTCLNRNMSKMYQLTYRLVLWVLIKTTKSIIPSFKPYIYFLGLKKNSHNHPLI